MQLGYEYAQGLHKEGHFEHFEVGTQSNIGMSTVVCVDIIARTWTALHVVACHVMIVGSCLVVNIPGQVRSVDFRPVCVECRRWERWCLTTWRLPPSLTRLRPRSCLSRAAKLQSLPRSSISLSNDPAISCSWRFLHMASPMSDSSMAGVKESTAGPEVHCRGRA